MKLDVDLSPLWEQVRRLTDNVDQTFFIEPRDSVQPIPITSEEVQLDLRPKEIVQPE